MAVLQCLVVTPERTVMNEEAEFLALPLFDGEIGIAPLHGPMIGRLGYGEMRIKQGNETKRYYVDGGFVQVVNDSVSILTNHAIPASDLDVSSSEKKLEAVLGKEAHSEEAILLKEKSEAQARARLRVAQRATKK